MHREKDIDKHHRTINKTFRQRYGGFCGWDYIVETLKTIKSPVTFQLFVGLFQTGARARELATLKLRQVDLDYSDDFIMINGMYVEKQREKLYLKDDDGNFILDEKGRRRFKMISVPGYRTFPIRKDNPLANVFIAYVKNFQGIGDDFLYPYKYGNLYYRIVTIGMNMPRGERKWWRYKGEWWPHRVRAERACQLIKDYNFNSFRLKKWFGWSSSQMPELYGDMVPTDLLESMDKQVDWEKLR